MRIFDVTIRVKANGPVEAEFIATSDLNWDYYNDEPASIWHEIVGVAERVA